MYSDQVRAFFTPTFKTVKDVEAWLFQLHKKGLLWHMDDNPTDIIWGGANIEGDVPNLYEMHALQAAQEMAWSMCDDAKVDIHALCIKVQGPLAYEGNAFEPHEAEAWDDLDAYVHGSLSAPSKADALKAAGTILSWVARTVED